MTVRAYPAYRESGAGKLGQIPDHWAVKPVWAVTTCNDDTLDESTSADFEFRYIEISDVNAVLGIINTSVVTFKSAPSRARRRVEDGDVIISTVRTYLRAITSIDNPEPDTIVSTGFAVFRPRAIDPKFMARLCQAEFFISDVISRSVGVSYPAINASDIARLRVPVPPIAEQSAIAAFLDRETGKIDALVAEQERLIALLKEKRQAVISHSVTKGLNPKVSMKDSGVPWLSEVPTYWIVTRVKTCATLITSGPRGWSERISDEGVLFIQSGDLDDDLRVQVTTAKRVNVNVDAEALRSQLQDGDVVVCITGAKTGNVGLFFGEGAEAYINQHLSLIRPNQNVRSRFLGYVLKGRPGQLHFDTSQYGLKQGLSLKDVDLAPIALPPLVEQDKIVSFLDQQIAQLDVLQIEATRAIALLRERRGALISAAVTGKIDVRGTITQPSSQAA